MVVCKLLPHCAFGPEEVKLLCAAYEEIIAGVEPSAVSQSVAEWIAKRIIALGRRGEIDLERLVASVRMELSAKPPSEPTNANVFHINGAAWVAAGRDQARAAPVRQGAHGRVRHVDRSQ